MSNKGRSENRSYRRYTLQRESDPVLFCLYFRRFKAFEEPNLSSFQLVPYYTVICREIEQKPSLTAFGRSHSWLLFRYEYARRFANGRLQGSLYHRLSSYNYVITIEYVDKGELQCQCASLQLGYLLLDNRNHQCHAVRELENYIDKFFNYYYRISQDIYFFNFHNDSENVMYNSSYFGYRYLLLVNKTTPIVSQTTVCPCLHQEKTRQHNKSSKTRQIRGYIQ